MSEEGQFVSRDECIKHITSTEKKIQTLLDAVCGPDLRGGMVKDINRLYTDVALLKKMRNGGNGNVSKKGWFGILGSIILAVSGIIIAIIN